MSRRNVDVVYIKNGDVLAHLARCSAAGEEAHQSGPDAFFRDFLDLTSRCRVLLLSKSATNRVSRETEKLQARTLWSGSTRLTRIIAKPLLFVRALYVLASQKPAWLLCGSSQEMLWASFVYSRIFGKPLVYSCHNRVSTGTDSLFRKATVFLDRFCIARVTRVVCHGPYLKSELQAIGVPADRIQEFDVDLTAFREAALRNSSGRGGLAAMETVLYIGRIERLKGVFDLLEAAAPYLQKDEDLRLLFVGQGAAADVLRQTIGRKKLQDQVMLLQRMPHHELAGLIADCKVVVTPSRSRFAEGRCMVAMESLVVGVPVVAPDFGPFPFLIEHGVNGLLFRPDSVEDLAEKLEAVLDDTELYSRLRSGASTTGNALLRPSQTFGEALAATLKDCVPDAGICLEDRRGHP